MNPSLLKTSDDISARTAELFQEQHQSIIEHTDRLFARLMIFQWVFGVALAIWISPRTWAGIRKSNTPAFVGGFDFGRNHYRCARGAGAIATGKSIDAPHHRRRPNAHVRVVDSFDRRPHRNAFSCFWLSGDSGLLSGLEGAHLGHGGGLCGPSSAGFSVAAIGLWGSERLHLAIVGTRGMGCI